MKLVKFITCAFAISLGFSAANAQQLPNPSFDEDWVKCYPWVAGKYETTAEGTQPTDWHAANVLGYKVMIIGWTGKTTVVSELTPGDNSTKAAKLFNVKISIGNNVIPGYLSLGTPWNTANTTGGNSDGGVFGGIKFTYQPDAMSFDYKRIHGDGSEQPATAVAYMWKGSTTQAQVPSNVANNATKVTMTDRDRNILGMETLLGGTVTKSDDFELIATLELSITEATDDWTSATVPFEYKSDNKPEMFNVVFSAMDYFADRSKHVGGDELDVDNVKLIYYSRLSDIKVNGNPIPDFADDKYEYNVDIPFTNDIDIDGTLLGKSAKQEVTLDPTNYTATIKVSNVDADNDGLSEHSYVVKFAAPQSGDEESRYVYKGTITIDMGDPINLENQEVVITSTGDATCNFALDNFALGEGAVLGDIHVNNVKITKNTDGTINYEGSTTGIKLRLPEEGPDGTEYMDITADADIEGTEDAEHNLVMNIHVKWLIGDPDDHDNFIPIEVTFNGKRTGDDPSGISSIEADNENAEPHYYRINGIEVKDASAPGLYIVRRGNKAEKIIVK